MGKAKPKDILIGEGDDWPTDYGHGFDKPMATITDIVRDSDNYQLPISWPEVLSGWEDAGKLLETLESIDSSCSVYELFDAIEGCSIDRTPWGGDSPGRSGIWTNVFVVSTKLEEALATVVKLSDALTKYWISSGKAAETEEYNREWEAKRAAEAAIKAEKARLVQEAYKLQKIKERKRAASLLVKRIGAFIREANAPFCVEGRFLVTAKGSVYVLADNTMRYFSYEDSVEQLAASRLRERGCEVIEVIEGYPEGTARIPNFAGGPMREGFMGWDYERSVLTSDTKLPPKGNPEVVRKAYLDWKNRAKV